MKISAFSLRALLVLSLTTLTSASDKERASVLTSESPMKCVAEGVKYEGGEVEDSNEPKMEKVVTAGDRTFFYGLWSWNIVLVAKRTGENRMRIYTPRSLAKSAGWLRTDTESFSNSLCGVFRGGDSIWIGTNGVGILEYDFVKENWARHDTQPAITRGAQAKLLYADADFVFCAYQGLEVFSVRERQWRKIDQVSTKNAELGHSPTKDLLPVGWDYRPYASKEYIPINNPAPTSGSFWGLISPNKMTYDEATDEYVLEFNNDWETKEPGVMTVLRVKKSDLSALAKAR